jgi:hypothetical protein
MMKFLCFFIYCTATVWGVSWEQFKDQTISVDLPQIFGWCSKEKAEKLMEFVLKTRPLVSVEIGPFCGATTYPMVRAVSFLGVGVVYAVDAWDLKTCFEGYRMDDPHVLSLQKMQINMEGAYQSFLSLLEAKQLKSHCYPLRFRSDQAVRLFSDETIDMVYFDGSDSAEGSLRDAILYLPKVKKGGHLWLNGGHLPNKVKAIAHLMKHCDWLEEESLGIECIVFKKR